MTEQERKDLDLRLWKYLFPEYKFTRYFEHRGKQYATLTKIIAGEFNGYIDLQPFTKSLDSINEFLSPEMNRRGFELQLYQITGSNNWWAGWYSGGNPIYAIDESPMLAICLAADKALKAQNESNKD